MEAVLSRWVCVGPEHARGVRVEEKPSCLCGHTIDEQPSRCRYEYGNDDGRLHQGKGSARASHPEAGPAHIRATSLPLSVPRRSLLSRSYLGWGFDPSYPGWRVFAEERHLWLRSGAGRAQLATSRVTGPVLAASSTSEMLYRSQWSRSGLSECIHVAVDGHHLMPV